MESSTVAQGQGQLRIDLLLEEDKISQPTPYKVKLGQRITWVNPTEFPCRVTAITSPCPFDHVHEECNFTVPAHNETHSSPVKGDQHQYFFESKILRGDSDGKRGTPRIIIVP